MLLSKNGNSRKQGMSVKELLEQPIYVPVCQRSIIDEHVLEIVAFQKQYYAKNAHYLFLNCIQYCIVDRKWFCVDGQHRYAALKLLDDLPDWQIDIEITYCKDMDEMHEIFRILNTNVPVPEFFKLEDEELYLMVAFKKYIQKKYASYMKSSLTPQRPNIHLDTFVDKMREIKQPEYRTLDELIEWFERENNEHREYLLTIKNEQCTKMLEKINRVTKTRNGAKFYLGCFWLDKIPNKIPSIIREQCWNTWKKECEENQCLIDGNVPCYVCSQTISSFHFEAGHIISHVNGGLTTVENLRPVCSMCNKRVGTKNMDEFKKSMNL